MNDAVNKKDDVDYIISEKKKKEHTIDKYQQA